MNAIQYEDDTLALPGRPRRKLWGPGSAVFLALLLGVIGFYAGVRVEKGQLASSAATPVRAPGATSAGAAARGGLRTPFAGAPGGAGNASFGTLTSVGKGAVYLTEASGNVVRVTLSSGTRITKSLPVGSRSLHPGDAVVVQGVKNGGGSIVAASLSDTGAGAARFGGGGAAAGSGSSASSAGSALNSLFGSSGAGR
jgi:hypothetical protein